VGHLITHGHIHSGDHFISAMCGVRQCCRQGSRECHHSVLSSKCPLSVTYVMWNSFEGVGGGDSAYFCEAIE
jgi:hypothetical protein